MENIVEEIPMLEPTGNKFEIFTPIEFAWINRKNNWKKCKCGHIVSYFDGWCGQCGQKLGFPERD